MTKVTNFVIIDEHNLKAYYNNPDGNLYFKLSESEFFELVDGFSYTELKHNLIFNRIKIIWISGACVGTEVSVDC